MGKLRDEFKIPEAQSYIPGELVAQVGIEFVNEFRDIYPASVLSYFMAVGPLQCLIGLAIKNGHLSLSALNDEGNGR